jgi:hypothetical protein
VSITSAELAATLAEGRDAFLVIATDTVLITRNDPTVPLPPMDPVTGVRPARTQKTIYRGPGRIQVRSDVNSNVVEVTAGEREWAYQTATCQIPVETPTGTAPDGTAILGSTADVRVDDTVTMVASEHDPELDTRKWQVRALGNKSHATSRRLRITEAVD